MTRIFATGCLMAAALTASAQEFGIEFNAGMQGLHYKVDPASARIQPGGSIGASYLFPFSKRWGLLTGISAGYYNTKTTLNNGAVVSSNEVDEEGSGFQYNARPTGYKETNRFFTGGIPIMLQYQTCGKTQWYMNAGTKLLFPFSVKTKATAQQFALSGYYPDYNVEIDNLPQHGFGVINNYSNTSSPEFKPTATISTATGLSFQIGDRLRLYTGLYFDYGLTDMRKEQDPGKALITYSARDVKAAQVNGMVARADKSHLLAYGIQVRLGISKKKSSPAPASAPAPVTEPAPVKEPAPVVAKLEPQPAEKAPEPVKEKTPEAVVAAITQTEEALIQEPVVFARINRTSVPEALKPHLDSVANILKQYPDLHVHIVGHTCDIGTEKENDKIGEARARSVAAYLQKKGIAAERIQTSSAGPTQPLVPNTSDLNRSKNRRVTIHVE